MRLCKMCCFVLLLPLFLLINFLNVSINASAALSGGRFMTSQECLDVFGSSFTVSYWDGTQIQQTVARYQSTATFGTVAQVAQTDYMQPGRSCLAYSFQGSISSSPEQIQIDLQPQYSLFNIDQLHTAILTPSNAVYTTPYQSPQWIWNLGGQRTVFEGLSSSAGEMYRTYVDNRLCIYCPVDWSSQSITSGYSIRATFCSGSLTPVDGVYYIYIGVPYITYDAEGSNGTVVTGTTSVSGEVNVDLTETNGILQGIQNLLSGLVDGVKGLFIPSQNALSTFVNAVDTLLHETFGIFYDNETLIHSALIQLLTGSAQESIYFEGFTMSLAGTSFTFPSFNVPLKPDNAHMSLLYTALASAIDIVCTLAFINMLKHKIWAVFMGEKIVEVEELDDAD